MSGSLCGLVREAEATEVKPDFLQHECKIGAGNSLDKIRTVVYAQSGL